MWDKHDVIISTVLRNAQFKMEKVLDELPPTDLVKTERIRSIKAVESYQKFVVEEFNKLIANEITIDGDLRGYGYAPGGYLINCSTCENEHVDMMRDFADKRAITCRKCAIIKIKKDIELLEGNKNEG